MAEKQIYYGWWVLSGLFVVYAASNGILVYSLPLLYPELMAEFGWSETQVTLPATVFFVVSALVSPPAGALLDLFSVRKLMALGAVGIVSGLLLYGMVTEVWQLVAVYSLFAISLALGGFIPSLLLVSRWFDRKRGRAIGILLMASSLGGAVFPLFLGYGIVHYGWRWTVAGCAGVALVLLFLPLWVLVRNRPEDRGLVPDGEPDGAVVAKADAKAVLGVSLGEAVRGRDFYLLALSTAAVWFSIIALTQHQSIYLGRDLGVSKEVLPQVFSLFFAASVIGKFLFGVLGDRFRKDRVMAGSIGLLAVGLLLLRGVAGDNPASLYLYAVVAGMGFSGALTSIQVLLARFYAGMSFGKILAVLVMIDTLAGALGTRVVAGIREHFGSYLPAIDLMIGVCALAVVCLALVRFRSLDGVTGAKGKGG